MSFSDSEPPSDDAEGNNISDPAQAIRDRIKKQLAEAQKARAIAQKRPIPQVDEVAIAIHRRAIQRMQEFLLTGEPILMTEVGQWLMSQPQSVRNELTAAGDIKQHLLLIGLAEIAMYLVLTKLSPMAIRLQLEKCYGKSLILELTAEERGKWLYSYFHSSKRQRILDDNDTEKSK